MLPGLDFEPLPTGKENRKGDELWSSHQVVEGSSERLFQNFGFGGDGLARAIELLSGWRARRGALACPGLPALTINPWKSGEAVYPLEEVSRREKPRHRGD
jgi:hypothetical protein